MEFLITNAIIYGTIIYEMILISKDGMLNNHNERV